MPTLKQFQFLLTFVFAFFHLQAFADSVHVTNTDLYDRYAQVHYVRGPKTQPASPVYTLPAVLAAEIIEKSAPIRQKVAIKRPERKINWRGQIWDRQLYATDDQELLQSPQYNHIDSANLGTLKMAATTAGKNEFFVTTDNGKVKILTYSQWKSRPFRAFLSDSIEKTIDLLKNGYKNYPYATQHASVRSTWDEENKERNSVHNRLNSQKTIDGFKKLLSGTYASEQEQKHYENIIESIGPDNLPRIGLCGSGGGYRAMKATGGSLEGADDIGLLDASTYIGGLSGSTWLISGWLTSKMDIKSYMQQLDARTNKSISSIAKNSDKQQIYTCLQRKVVFSIPISIVDIYGNLIGQELLTGLQEYTKPKNMFLFDQAPLVQSGQVPFPIYTAVIAPENSLYQDYKWFIFTPFECGGPAMGSYIDTWALGRSFIRGSDVEPAPPQPLCYFMGIWGSAFAVNFKEAIREVIGGNIYPPFLEVVMNEIMASNIGEYRASSATINNFTYKASGLPYNDWKRLTLIDAGIDYNLPLPPLYVDYRKTDITICLDQSGIVKDAPELRKAEDFFRRNKELKVYKKFPKIDHSQVNQVVSVHGNPLDKETTTLIYLPLVPNPEYQKGEYKPLERPASNYTGTFNFKYSVKESKELRDLTKKNMETSKAVIAEVVKLVIDRKDTELKEIKQLETELLQNSISY